MALARCDDPQLHPEPALSSVRHQAALAVPVRRAVLVAAEVLAVPVPAALVEHVAAKRVYEFCRGVLPNAHPITDFLEAAFPDRERLFAVCWAIATILNLFRRFRSRRMNSVRAFCQTPLHRSPLLNVVYFLNQLLLTRDNIQSRIKWLT